MPRFINSLSTPAPRQEASYPPLADEETEAEGEVQTYPRVHSWEGAELGHTPGSLTSKLTFLCSQPLAAPMLQQPRYLMSPLACPQSVVSKALLRACSTLHCVLVPILWKADSKAISAMQKIYQGNSCERQDASGRSKWEEALDHAAALIPVAGWGQGGALGGRAQTHHGPESISVRPRGRPEQRLPIRGVLCLANMAQH